MLDDGANTTQIGGPTVAGRNVISGNRDDGIDLVFTAHDNDIVDNFIGTNVSGTAPLGNLNFGIYDQATGTGNRIGDDSDPNVIAFNGATTGADGIRVNGALGAYGLEIAGNSIFSNGGLGIALTNNGNNDLPSPDITSVATAAGKTTIDGTYLAPADNYLIEVFANSACDPSGGGEGRKFLNEVQVSTAAGLAHWELVVPALSPGMKIVTATAIRGSTADTSQFSACKS
jgi:parallel beta-helix repeat protein